MTTQTKHAQLKAFCAQNAITTRFRPGQEMQWSAETKNFAVEAHSEVLAIRALCKILEINCPF